MVARLEFVALSCQEPHGATPDGPRSSEYQTDLSAAFAANKSHIASRTDLQHGVKSTVPALAAISSALQGTSCGPPSEQPIDIYQCMTILDASEVMIPSKPNDFGAELSDRYAVAVSDRSIAWRHVGVDGGVEVVVQVRHAHYRQDRSSEPTGPVGVLASENEPATARDVHDGGPVEAVQLSVEAIKSSTVADDLNLVVAARQDWVAPPDYGLGAFGRVVVIGRNRSLGSRMCEGPTCRCGRGYRLEAVVHNKQPFVVIDSEISGYLLDPRGLARRLAPSAEG